MRNHQRRVISIKKQFTINSRNHIIDIDKEQQRPQYWGLWDSACNFSSVASPICQEGQSKRNFPIFAFSSRFFPIFGNFFAVRGGTLPSLPPQWLRHCLTVFALVLKIAQPRGKIDPGTFKFILSLHFSEKNSESTTYTGGRVSFQSWEVGGWCDPVIFELDYFLKIFEVICTHKFLCKLEWPFFNIFLQKKTWKWHVFTIFYVKINFCLYFTHKMAISQFSWARSHYDVIVTSYING